MTQAVFLDRDGTLNVDHGYVHRIEDWQWQEGAIEALKILQEKNFALIVVTNQSGIGHGLYNQEDMEKMHEYMTAELQKNDIKLFAILFCPHRRDEGCRCRKPGLGMVESAQEKLEDIDYTASWTVGDKLADVGFGSNLGTRTALLRSRYWQESDLMNHKVDVVVDSLLEAVRKIVEL